MILTMKQSISISDVQKILPADSNEDCVRSVYEPTPKNSGSWPCSSTSRSKAPPPTSTPSGNEEGAVGRGWSSVRTHRRVLQNSGGKADPPVRRADTEAVLAAEQPHE